MRIWLTAMFMLVTAFAAVVAYEIVRPILEDTLNRASQTRFEEVAEQFEDLLQRDNTPNVAQLESFTATRGLQWGIVKAKTGEKLLGDKDLDWQPVP